MESKLEIAYFFNITFLRIAIVNFIQENVAGFDSLQFLQINRQFIHKFFNIIIGQAWHESVQNVSNYNGIERFHKENTKDIIKMIRTKSHLWDFWENVEYIE